MKPRPSTARFVAGVAVGAALLTGLFAVVEQRRTNPPPRPVLPPPADAPSRVAPAATTPPPAPAAPPIAARPIRLSPPYGVADGLTIVSETRLVRLAGLEGPASEAACFDRDNKLWACGLQARAALNNLIRLRDIVCRPLSPPAAKVPQVACMVGEEDVGRALVEKGFARPLAGGDAALQVASEDARREGRGLWNGGWRIAP